MDFESRVGFAGFLEKTMVVLKAYYGFCLCAPRQLRSSRLVLRTQSPYPEPSLFKARPVGVYIIHWYGVAALRLHLSRQSLDSLALRFAASVQNSDPFEKLRVIPRYFGHISMIVRRRCSTFA